MQRQGALTIFIVVLIAVFSLISPPVYAGDCCGKVMSDNYAVRAPARLFHGILNAGLGWTELFTAPVREVRHEGKNVVEGIFDGLANTIYYTALGAWDIGTFWFPGEGGKDIAVKTCVLMKEQCTKPSN